MTAIESHIRRINAAESIEALSDIARDIEALMSAEHAPKADRDAVADAVMRRRNAIADRLMAG